MPNSAGTRRAQRSGLVVAALVGASLACGAAQPPPKGPADRRTRSSDPDAFRAIAPPLGPPIAWQYPTAQRAKLRSGLTVLLVPKKAATVTVSVVSRSGGSATGAQRAGLAALTLRMMTEGTLHHPGPELARAVEVLGANLEHDTDRDGCSLSMEVLREDLPNALTLLGDVVKVPSFASDDFERVRFQWLQTLQAIRQEPRSLASLAALELLYGPQAASPVLGTAASIHGLTRRDLVVFHARHFVAPNLAVVVSGDVALEELTGLVRRHFASLPVTAPPLRADDEPKPPGTFQGVFLIDRPGAVQTAIFAVQHFPRRTEPAAAARDVLNNLLGGLFTSRLNLNLREKNAFTYGIRSLVLSTRAFGGFAITTSVKTKTTARALAEILGELERLKGSPHLEPGELDRAKADLVRGYGSSLEHASRLQGDAEDLFVDGLRDDHYDRYIAELRGVEEPSVLEQAKRLRPEQLVVVMVGDRATIAPLLAKKGWASLDVPSALSR